MLRLRISPPAEFEPKTPCSDVGSAWPRGRLKSAWRHFFGVNKTITQARDCAFMKMSEAGHKSLKISILLSKSVLFVTCMKSFNFRF